MTLLEAIQVKNKEYIVNGDLKLRISNRKFYDKLGNQYTFTTTDQLFADWQVE